MPNSPGSTAQASDTVHRTVRLRLFPGDAATDILLTAIACACRYVYHMLADCEWWYARWKEMYVPALNWPELREGKTAWAKAVRKKMGSGPSTSFFTLGQRFTELSDDPDHAWLKDYPYGVVRYSLKYLADAYARYKVGELRKVAPAYTSQRCSRCGHVDKSNRPSQAVFACGACGFRANADHNAAVNILVRAGLPCVPVLARGTGASARRGAIPWGTPTTRERDGPTVQSGL